MKLLMPWITCLKVKPVCLVMFAVLLKICDLDCYMPFGHVTSLSASGEIQIGGQEHFYMETQSILVIPAGEEMEYKVYVSSQWPTLVQVCGL